jgi:hypothetical protein
LSLPDIIGMTDLNEMYDTQCKLTERRTETNVLNFEFKRMYKDLLSDISRKKQRQCKRVATKREKMTVKDIPGEALHLSTTHKSHLRRLTKVVIWKSIKFWHVELEKMVVDKALKHLHITGAKDKACVSNFVRTYMEKCIILRRNNTIGAMKKLVCSERHRKGK